ncbi:hypothetical protein ARMSODRAFT_736927 [Armillaria solidipes]|uniref:Uncharacterized protein n=1 Tax=Armillaria solidipes TaxID=1076256 RepID=A0A2H3AMY4_9AGAR|nr:hypothetical protein ARMSODRAFT_736927 [Armillaria solidipes]
MPFDRVMSSFPHSLWRHLFEHYRTLYPREAVISTCTQTRTSIKRSLRYLFIICASHLSHEEARHRTLACVSCNAIRPPRLFNGQIVASRHVENYFHPFRTLSHRLLLPPRKRISVHASYSTLLPSSPTTTHRVAWGHGQCARVSEPGDGPGRGDGTPKSCLFSSTFPAPSNI